MDNETGGRAAPVADAHENGAWIGWRCTIPPARLTPTHLPLHKGGKGQIFTLLFLFSSACFSSLVTANM